MMILFKLYGLYDRDVKRISYSTVDDLPWLFHATLIGALAGWLYTKLTPVGHLEPARDGTLGAFTLALVLAARGRRCVGDRQGFRGSSRRCSSAGGDDGRRARREARGPTRSAGVEEVESARSRRRASRPCT